MGELPFFCEAGRSNRSIVIDLEPEKKRVKPAQNSSMIIATSTEYSRPYSLFGANLREKVTCSHFLNSRSYSFRH